jgi:hypothetical protein
MKSWVYKILKDDVVIYVGSCTRKYFSQRKGDHTKPTTLNSNKQPMLQNYVKDNGGWETFTFEIIFEYETIDKDNLLIKEKEQILLLKPICNCVMPGQTDDEKKIKDREQRRIFHENNPDILVRKNQHKVSLESYKEYQKKRCSTKIICLCGGSYTLQNKTNHYKRNIHIEYENAKESNNV